MEAEHPVRVRRRSALKGMLAAAAGLVAGFSPLRAPAARAQAQLLTVSGGGVNVKEMPSPDGSSMVPLREAFSFDAFYAQCIIEDNPAAFAMDTYEMGRVVMEAHSFFMAMHSRQMALTSVRRTPDGKRVAKLEGELDCATFVGTATVRLGSRTENEQAFFEIEATDGRRGGEGDSFAFTVYFDPARAPLNHAIFGPNPTFTGEMVIGEVTIGTPTVRELVD